MAKPRTLNQNVFGYLLEHKEVTERALERAFATTQPDMLYAAIASLVKKKLVVINRVGNYMLNPEIVK